MKRAALLFVAVLVDASLCLADDAYLIRFHSPGMSTNTTYWRDEVLFFNTNAAPAEVKFLGVSNWR